VGTGGGTVGFATIFTFGVAEKLSERILGGRVAGAGTGIVDVLIVGI
jgi:hypothetical protein